MAPTKRNKKTTAAATARQIANVERRLADTRHATAAAAAERAAERAARRADTEVTSTM